MREVTRRFEVTLVNHDNKYLELTLSEGGIMRVRFTYGGSSDYQGALQYIMDILDSEMAIGFEEFDVFIREGEEE